MIKFRTIGTKTQFVWSRIDVLVTGLSFDEMMIKLKSFDRSWLI